ncbi:TonB-dependent receptor [Qipengyuania sp. MTN3-11]|uniref:TonB-dependent receptor n=1 Tax=Qipengyuania sp. MTN3-11 TaxID=3056557 RepID=UPI0036F42522
MLYHNHFTRFNLRASALVLATSLLAAPLAAQDGTQTQGDDLHDRRVDSDGVIVVTGPGLEQLDVLTGTSIVEGEELQRELDGQIGEVLAKQPGVSATSFSPGASRPVLRGFDGERVRVLVDGIGTIDVSNTSADHAVTVEPLTVERVEILRGPAVLLYGSQAIGGAVNIIDKRIPTRRLREPFHLDVLAEGDTARDLRSGAASLDLPVGANLVLHADGSYRNTDDLEIPGLSIAPDLRADLLADAAEEEAEGEFEEADELREAANQRGVLPNSYTETWSANAGAAIFAGESNLGVSIGWYDTLYGVPGRPGAGHHHGEEEGGDEAAEEEEGEERVSIDMRQFRADMRGELALGDGFFSTLRTRVGYSDYVHTEFEGEEVGTVFDVEGIEGRAELIQNRRGALGGSIGVQYYYRDFEAIGAEAFVAPNLTNQFAVFALQEVDLGGFQIEGAARYETVDISSDALGVDRDFGLFSGALSLIVEPGEGDLRFGVTGSRVERAPGGEELFANGPHIATQAFEIGDPSLTKESALGVEGFVRGSLGPATVSFSIYQNWFDDYIYLQGTGLEEDDLPVFQYLQGDADYFGLEGEVSFPIIENQGFTLSGDVRGDYVKAELDDGTPLPRIPPLSLLGALEADVGAFGGRVEVQYFAEQDDIAPFETPTDDFTFVNASLSFTPIRGNDTVRVLLRADNIFDVTGRRHASFTKDFVPLSGRNFKVSLLGSF